MSFPREGETLGATASGRDAGYEARTAPARATAYR